MVHSTADYLMAQERSDRISLAQLTTVEVLINSDDRLQLVVKNEQLPLKANNHCKAIFETVSGALLEGVSGVSKLS